MIIPLLLKDLEGWLFDLICHIVDHEDDEMAELARREEDPRENDE